MPPYPPPILISTLWPPIIYDLQRKGTPPYNLRIHAWESTLLLLLETFISYAEWEREGGLVAPALPCTWVWHKGILSISLSFDGLWTTCEGGAKEGGETARSRVDAMTRVRFVRIDAGRARLSSSSSSPEKKAFSLWVGGASNMYRNDNESPPTPVATGRIYNGRRRRRGSPTTKVTLRTKARRLSARI